MGSVLNPTPGGGDEILKLVGVKKNFGSTEVLRNVDLTLQRGQMVAIVGPSGSGKSTLLHIAGGLELPSAGEVFLFGKRIDTLPEDERDRFRRGRVAYIFQDPYLLEDFSVYENLEIFARLAGRKVSADEIEHILELLGLSHRKDYKPSVLSGGERQRVAVGRALVTGAPLILADEPTGNLDPERAKEVFSLFRELKEKMGTTFLVVTHNRDLLGFFDKTYLLRGGQLSFYFP